MKEWQKLTLESQNLLRDIAKHENLTEKDVEGIAILIAGMKYKCNGIMVHING